MQVSPVTKSGLFQCLHPVCCYKRPLKEEQGFCLLGALIWAFCFEGLFAFECWEETFTLGLLVWEAFGREKNY
jgi:hypothetical protein